MVDVITQIDISAPLEKVAAYASDPDKAPEWYENIKSVEWVSAKPMALGSEIAFVAHFLGRKLSYVYRIEEWSAEKLVMRTADGPFPMETTYTWEKLDEHTTRMTLRNRGNPSGFSQPVRPVYGVDDAQGE